MSLSVYIVHNCHEQTFLDKVVKGCLSCKSRMCFKGSEHAFSSFHAQRSVLEKHKVDPFLFLSLAARTIPPSLKLMDSAIYRRLPVKIIGIIPSLPVLNYRPVAFWIKRAVWPWSGRIMEGLHSHHACEISTAVLGEGRIRTVLFYPHTNVIPNILWRFSPTVYVYLVEHVLTLVHLFSQDPSVTQVRQAAAPGLEEYNPFTDARPVSTSRRNLVAVSSYIHVWMWTTLTRFRGLMYF